MKNTVSKKGPAKKTVALVNKVVNRKLKQYIETKSSYATLGQFHYANDLRAVNLIHHMSQGDTNVTYTGRSINLKSIHIKGRMHLENPGNQPNGICCRFMIIRTKKALTNSSSVITTTDVLRALGQQYFASTGHVDFGKVQLLYDKKHVVQPFNSDGNANRYISYDIKVPFKGKKVYWDENNSGYLKDGNYYLVTTIDSIGASQSIDRVGVDNIDWTVNFQDA